MARRHRKIREPQLGGPPEIAAANIAVTRDLSNTRDGFRDREGRPLSAGTQTLSLEISPQAARNGAAVQELVREAIRSGHTREGIIRLGKIIKVKPDVVLRMPEFTAFAERLVADNNEAVLRRILDDVEGRPGRRSEPHREFYVIGLIDRVREQEGFDSDAKAASWLSAHMPGLALSTARIRNICSEHRRAYSALFGSIFIPGEQLTAAAYVSPEQAAKSKRRT